MRRNIKRIVAIATALFMSVGTVNAPTYALNNIYESAELECDVSNKVLQNGGFLEGDITYDSLSDTYTLETGKYLSGLSSEYESAINTLVDAWNKHETSVDISKYKIPNSEISSFYANAINNHPECFYVNGGCSYRYNGATGCITYIQVKYDYSKAESDAMVLLYEKAIKRALAGVDSSWSDIEKVMYLNTFLTTNCTYDLTYSKYSAYNVMVEKTAVCQGYSLAFNDMAKRLGLDSVMVTSTALKHAWNMVKVNGTYYHIDTTWNDPTYDIIGRSRHQFFLKSSSAFNTAKYKHQASDWTIGNNVKASEASSTKYDGYFLDSYDNGFYYVNGKWWTYDKSTYKIVTFDCDGNDFINREVVTSPQIRWYVSGDSGSYYSGYTQIAAFNDEVYYSEPYEIKKIDKEGNITTYYTLADSDKAYGKIYGMTITSDGEVKIGVSPSPNESGKTILVETFEVSEVETETETETESKTETETETETSSEKTTTEKETETSSEKTTTEKITETSSEKTTTEKITETSSEKTTTEKETESESKTTTEKITETSSEKITTEKETESESKTTTEKITETSSEKITETKETETSIEETTTDKETESSSKETTVIKITDTEKATETTTEVETEAVSKVANSITILKGNKTITGSATKNVTTTISAKAKYGAVTYKSSTSSVKVDKNGKVTVVKGYTGTAKITVKSKGDLNYISKSKIVLINVNPPKTTLSGSKAGTKTLTVKWKKNSLASKYIVYVSTSKSFTKSKNVNVNSKTITSVKVKGLNSGKIYYVKIKAIAKSGKSSISNIKSIRVK